MSRQPRIPVELATTPAQLADACDKLREAGELGFDTEFVGEDTYQTQVCLVQAATRTTCYLIDPLPESLDLTPFWQLVADATIEVLVHAGSEDLALCWRQTGLQPVNVIDLQIAAGFVGMGYPTSLSRLAHLADARTLHKSQTLTDWRRRPLQRAQIDYAVEDVACLRPIWDKLKPQLVAAGRMDWLREECDALCRAAAVTRDATARLYRLAGSGSLRPRELATAHALLRVRDEIARAVDRPARVVLRDHLIVELAKRGWTDVEQIKTLRGLNLNAGNVQRLAAAVAEAKRLPESQLPERMVERETAREDLLVAFVSTVLKDYCDRSGLSYALLVTRQDLLDLVRSYMKREGPSDAALRNGWRAIAVGELLDRVLTGRARISVSTRPGEQGLHIE